MRYLLVPILFLVCLSAYAQTDAGSIRVLVSDSSGSVLPNADVELTNAGTGAVISHKTSADGYAMFTPIVRGAYRIAASLPGFSAVRISGVNLDVDERKLVRITLPLESVKETLEVHAEAVTIQSEQGSLGQVIEGSVATELPLAARRYSELALLVPGTTDTPSMDPSTRGYGWFSANGNYHTQNNFMIDGVDNNQGTTNAQSLSAQVVQPSPDSIAEFKVQTNGYSAEFGRSAGAVVNVSIKSGTNDKHGSAWYYNRDKSLAATPWATNLIGGPKPDLQWNQFGGVFGGPIKRNKLFYFASYEGFLQDFATQFLTNVPTLAERQGVFYRDIRDPQNNNALFPNRTIPQSRWDPLAAKLLDLFPEPNLPGRLNSSGQTIENYGVQRNGHENTQKGDLKGDYNADDKDMLSLRWSTLRQDIFREGIFPGIADGVGNQGSQFNANQSFGATWTRTISPTVVNFFRFGYTRTNASFAQASAGLQSATDFGFKGIPAESLNTGGIPLINVGNYNNLGVRNFRPQFQKPELFQFIDTLSLVRGSHSLRAGFETRQKNNSFLDSARTVPAYTFNGNYTGESLADMLLGDLYQFDANSQAIVEQRQKAYAGFFQDDWKLSRTLTLNLGLRYEYTTPFYGAGKNLNINFDPATGQLVRAKSPTDYLVNPDHNDWGPRFGMAWEALPSRLVVRGGYGIFYSGEDISGSDVNLPENPPQLIPVTIVRQGNGPAPFQLSDPIPSGLFGSYYNTGIVNLRAREKDYHAGRVRQFNLATQVRLPVQSSLEIAYVGNRGDHLYANYALNQTPYGVDGSVARNRPYPQWSQITMGSQRAESWYNALQAKFEKRFTHGWQTLASYTYASAIDEAGAWGSGSSPQYLDDFRHDRGPSTNMPRHRFTLSGIYQLPFGRGREFASHANRFVDALIGGWQIAPIFTARGGLPLNISMGTGNVPDPNTGLTYPFYNRNGGSQRPDRVGDPDTGIDPKQDRFHFLNPAAFRVPAPNSPGNAGRNIALGPQLRNLDASLSKSFAATERVRVYLRLEAFNALNQVNFGNPNTSFGSSNFGIISSAGSPRVIQTAIRATF